ncbi:MAG: sterol desaturase family protein [Rhodospirillales bacterium]|nr:sterol desaturase family protein [Rhodospirillales bacterium]
MTADDESFIRLAFFFGIFAAVAAWEVFAPRRVLTAGRRARWPGNLGIVLLDTLIVRAIFPAGAIGIALAAEAKGFGLLNAVALSFWLEAALAFVALDLAIYLQHVLFHAVPALWRLHRMHHADIGFDVTTGARFHPIEIVLSMLIKTAVIMALGAPAIAVLVFEIALSATALFNHANARLPAALDRGIRLLVVTPDMHRVHHSAVPVETSSNFGFNLPWWDRLFGTYRAAPAAGHEAMTIGLAAFRDPGELRLDKMLIQPFRGEAGAFALGRREA